MYGKAYCTEGRDSYPFAGSRIKLKAPVLLKDVQTQIESLLGNVKIMVMIYIFAMTDFQNVRIGQQAYVEGQINGGLIVENIMIFDILLMKDYQI